MKLYHRTDAAEEILANGFRDGEGKYFTRRRHRGVWLSNVPLDINEGAKGEQLLEIEIPEEQMKRWEWIQEGGLSYREFLMPAKQVIGTGLRD